MDAPLRTGPPLVTLRNASARPYDGAIAAARTCYSPRVIGPDEVTPGQRDSIGPNGYGFRVYTDPIGHPFCLCRNKGVTWTDQTPIWPKRN